MNGIDLSCTDPFLDDGSPDVYVMSGGDACADTVADLTSLATSFCDGEAQENVIECTALERAKSTYTHYTHNCAFPQHINGRFMRVEQSARNQTPDLHPLFSLSPHHTCATQTCTRTIPHSPVHTLG